MSSVWPRSPAPCHTCKQRQQDFAASHQAGRITEEEGEEQESKVNHLQQHRIPEWGWSRSGKSCSSTLQPCRQKSPSLNLSLAFGLFVRVFVVFFPKSSAEMIEESWEDGRVRTTAFFHGSFSPSSAQLCTRNQARGDAQTEIRLRFRPGPSAPEAPELEMVRNGPVRTILRSEVFGMWM